MTTLNVFTDNPVTLPQRVEFEGASAEADICIRFLRHLSAVPSQNSCMKVLSSIQFVADLMGYSDAHISKILVELGLRAPSGAFPEAYIQHVDKTLNGAIWSSVGPSLALSELTRHWYDLGEYHGNVTMQA